MRWNAIQGKAVLRLRRIVAFTAMGIFFGAVRGAAQESPQAPIAPPAEHDVRRMGNVPEAAAPPALPPEEIIKRFAEKEDQYLSVRPSYGSRRTIRIDEFD